ncbi:MAG: zinc ribbon domain-containing protein [Lachnospiraceae bacterium]|nr:zinc ribbon domain-containing protein [Lachnospiraceae bacterium]
MAFCTFCGNILMDNACFCSACGREIKKIEINNRNETNCSRDIHKCPNCGEILEAFASKCISCGYEIRDNTGSKILLQFEKEYKSLTSDKRKIELIKNYVIPNSREDILEFVFFSASNIDVDAFSYDKNSLNKHTSKQDISDAWFSKLEQAYYKAGITLINDPSYKAIKEIYENKKDNLCKAQNKFEHFKIKNEKEKRFDDKAIIWFIIILWSGLILLAIICEITGIDI